MTVETMTMLGYIGRVVIYNPLTYSVILAMFLIFVLSEISHDNE